jgi:hypothetical protein
MQAIKPAEVNQVAFRITLFGKVDGEGKDLKIGTLQLVVGSRSGFEPQVMGLDEDLTTELIKGLMDNLYPASLIRNHRPAVGVELYLFIPTLDDR